MNAPKSVTALIAIAMSALCASFASAESVTFSRISGGVSVEVDGKPVAVRNGSVLKTPIRIVTSVDGALHIEQPSSSLDIGPDSVIVVPGTQGQTGVVEKILQELGRVLYSVKPRKSGSFLVETPYLVSVVKGTTFSVAIDESSTAVTLLEGLIEVSGPGTEDRALLQPNQRAVRAASDRTIAVSIVNTTAAIVAPRASMNPPPASIQAFDPAETLSLQANRVAEDLGQITAAYVETRAPTNTAPETQPTEPSTPGAPELPIPPQPEITPTPPVTPPEVTPTPQPDPMPIPDPGVGDDDDGHDDDDDGNNGHGNDDDGHDDSNPGGG
jgi:hypothetical protein